MNLLDIRKKFLDISGRTDLVDEDTYVDMGANYYINAGLRWLDRHIVGKHGMGRYFKQWPAGTYTITIPTCRVIKEVWCYDDETRWQLVKKGLAWLRNEYPYNWRSMDRGTPLYYAPTVIRLYPASDELTVGDADFGANQANVVSGETFGYDGIVILPPPELEVNIEVWGLFDSKPLINDTDTNFWSITYPDVLIHAALRAVEIDHRNTQGVDDWTRAIYDMVGKIDHDEVDEETTDINQMEG